jgi:hypothetical protein
VTGISSCLRRVVVQDAHNRGERERRRRRRAACTCPAAPTRAPRTAKRSSRREVAVGPAAAPDGAKRTLFPTPRHPTLIQGPSGRHLPDRDDPDETSSGGERTTGGTATGVNPAAVPWRFWSNPEKTVAPMDADGSR